MRRNFGVILTIAAASLALAGCEREATEEPAEEAAAEETVETETPEASANGAATGEMCGGIAGIQCAAATDYCAMDVGQCDMPDAAGTCTPRPEICTEQYDPVCGCDGKTYGNACEAASAGVNVRTEGECAAEVAE